MADEELIARLRVEAEDATGPALRSIADNIDRTKRTFEQLGSGLLLGRTFQEFANMQRAMERLQFSTGAMDSQMRSMSKAFEEVAKNTGQSVENIAKGFNKFLDLSGQEIGPAIEQFKTIAEAAKITGVSMEGLARAAAAAVTDLRVPSDQIADLVKRWSVEVPATMLESFSQMAPRLMQAMDAVGLSGKKNAEEIATVFGNIAKASGSPRQAFLGLNTLLNQMNNAGTKFGMVMSPVLDEVTSKGGDLVDQIKAVYKALDDMNAFAPENQRWVQQTFGVDSVLLKTLKTFHNQEREITEQLRKATDATEEFDKASQKIDKGPKAAIDSLKTSVEGLGLAFSHLLVNLGADEALQGLAKIMENAAKAADYIERRATESGIVEKEFNALEDLTPGQGTRAIKQGSGAAAGAWMGSAGFIAGPVVGTATTAIGAGAGYFIGDRSADRSDATQHGGGMTEKQLQDYAKRRGLAGPEAHATGGIITRPTLSTLGENGPEAVIPLGGANGGGGTNENTQATKDLNTSIERLIRRMEDDDTRHAGGQRLAYTPGAGELGVPATAQVYGGGSGGGATGSWGEDGGGGGGGSGGAMFRPGIGQRSGGRTSHSPGGGEVPRHFGASGPDADTSQEYALPPGTGNEWLQQQRAPFAEELKDPKTRQLLQGIVSAENVGAGSAVAESLMNRTMLVNQNRAKRGLPPLKLRDMILGHPSIGGGKSFYNPVRNGSIRSHLQRVQNDPKYAARINGYIDQALHGSDRIEGHTDQGSAGDPNYETGGVGVNINRERFNDWGYPGSRKFRESFESHVHASPSVTQNKPAQNASQKLEDKDMDAKDDAWFKKHTDDGQNPMHPEHQSMLESHRAMRAEMERPIKLAMDTPDGVGRRQRMQRIQSRMQTEDGWRTPRYASQLDIGFG